MYTEKKQAIYSLEKDSNFSPIIAIPLIVHVIFYSHTDHSYGFIAKRKENTVEVTCYENCKKNLKEYGLDKGTITLNGISHEITVNYVNEQKFTAEYIKYAKTLSFFSPKAEITKGKLFFYKPEQEKGVELLDHRNPEDNEKKENGSENTSLSKAAGNQHTQHGLTRT